MKKQKLSLMLKFIREFQYSTIAQGWMAREQKRIAIGENKTMWVDKQPSFDDIEQYIDMPLKTIVKMLKKEVRTL